MSELRRERERLESQRMTPASASLPIGRSRPNLIESLVDLLL